MRPSGETKWSSTYVVGLLLILVALLVGGSLGLIGTTLLVVEGLPALTQDLANLAERNAGVLLANVLALLVGEEHVGRQTALRSVGVWQQVSMRQFNKSAPCDATSEHIPFLARFFSTLPPRLLAAALGILNDGAIKKIN